MSIDWASFTPFSAFGGGLLIGLAALMLFAFNGRIAGVSSIIGGLLERRTPAELAWREAFVLGLLLAPSLYALFAELPAVDIEAGWLRLLIAGLLVGFGASIGSGCTSGHGVCGLSRLSLRSLVATLCFMASGFATVYLFRHLAS